LVAELGVAIAGEMAEVTTIAAAAVDVHAMPMLMLVTYQG
jgi:hypothetical protein